MLFTIILGANPWATPQVEAQTGWRMFRGDLRHSGFSDTDAPADSMLAWRYDSPASIVNSSPVLAQDGTIYIGNSGRELLALSPHGTLRWQFKAAGNFRHSAPAVAPDGTIYIGGSDGRLYAIRPDGTLRWTFSANAGIRTSPNLGTDGTIYFGADDGRLYAVRPDSTLLWTYQTGGDSLRSSPAIGPDGNIYLGGTDRYLHALWPNGTLRWRALTGGPLRVNSPSVDSAGNVYCGSSDGFVSTSSGIEVSSAKSRARPRTCSTTTWSASVPTQGCSTCFTARIAGSTGDSRPELRSPVPRHPGFKVTSTRPVSWGGSGRSGPCRRSEFMPRLPVRA